MADWRKLAKSLALADGRIDEKETKIIKDELLADGAISKSELEFILDIRNSADSCVQSFHNFVHSVVKKVILADGDISAKEAAWLKKYLFADGKLDEGEKKLLQDLKTEAKAVSPEFKALYDECMKM